MQRIQAPGCVARRPLRVERTQAPGFFSPGEPSIGQQATLVTADFLNDVQEELLSTIEGAGLEPTAENTAQLLAAIGALAKRAVDAIPAADTAQKGLVQLSDAVDSADSTTAASSKAVKTVKDAIPALSDAVDSDSSSTAASSKAVKTVKDAIPALSDALDSEDSATAASSKTVKTLQDGKVDAAGAASAAMPRRKYTSISVLASGSHYKAPNDGYITVAGYSSGGNGYLKLEALIGSTATAIPAGKTAAIFVPVSKDFDIVFTYEGVSGMYIWFIPCMGVA